MQRCQATPQAGASPGSPPVVVPSGVLVEQYGRIKEGRGWERGRGWHTWKDPRVSMVALDLPVTVSVQTFVCGRRTDREGHYEETAAMRGGGKGWHEVFGWLRDQNGRETRASAKGAPHSPLTRCGCRRSKCSARTAAPAAFDGRRPPCRVCPLTFRRSSRTGGDGRV